LAAAFEQPGMQRVAAVERAGEEKIAVVAGKEGARGVAEPFRMHAVPRPRAFVIETGQFLGELLPQPCAFIRQITLAAAWALAHSRAGPRHAAIEGASGSTARGCACANPFALATSARAARLARPSIACT